MMMAKYCKSLGMDLQEFRAYKQAVEDEAQTIYDRAKKIRPQGTGMYFPTSELIEVKEQRDYYIINELKALGVEFIENGKLYRI